MARNGSGYGYRDSIYISQEESRGVGYLVRCVNIKKEFRRIKNFCEFI